MRVFLDQSSKTAERAAIPTHTLYVAPAADLKGQACPSEWVTNQNQPITFEARFIHGMFDTTASGVPDSVARYMLDRKLAVKSRPLFKGL